MKANKLFFYTVASLLTVQSMSPDFINNVQPSHGRMPASAATTAKKKVVKKAVTSKEMKALQDKLAQLEVDLHKKEDLLDQKSKEIELLKNNKTEEKIDALTKLIVEQKTDVDKLKNDIKNSEVKDVKIVNQNKTAIEVVVCKSESKGEKLEADIKKLLDDKEEVLKRVDGLKKENDELKLKLTAAPEVKKQEIAKTEVKAEVKVEKEESIAEDKAPVAKKSQALDKKLENSELMALMSQMTTMFTTQMQSQMQMQVQMMNMLSQMQTNMMPQTNPYSPSLYSNNFMNNYAHGYPSLNDSIGSYGLGMGLGISAQSSPWSDYSNPYSMAPSIKRQQLSAPADFGFSFNQAPYAIRGFDFNQAPAASQKSQQALPQPELQKQQLSYSLPIISA
jgi:myosin heavy subunit